MEATHSQFAASAGAGRGVLSFREARRSVFAVTLFIDEADLTVPEPPRPLPQWQLAAGRRVLTAVEQAARERYFADRAERALAKLRAALPPAPSPAAA